MGRFRGVRQRHWGSWVAEIRHPLLKTRVWLGTFESEEGAARAYDEAARLMSGDKAKTNFKSSTKSPSSSSSSSSSSSTSPSSSCSTNSSTVISTSCSGGAASDEPFVPTLLSPSLIAKLHKCTHLAFQAPTSSSKLKRALNHHVKQHQPHPPFIHNLNDQTDVRTSHSFSQSTSYGGSSAACTATMASPSSLHPPASPANLAAACKPQSITCLRLDPEQSNIGLWHAKAGASDSDSSKSHWVIMTLELDYNAASAANVKHSHGIQATCRASPIHNIHDSYASATASCSYTFTTRTKVFPQSHGDPRGHGTAVVDTDDIMSPVLGRSATISDGVGSHMGDIAANIRGSPQMMYAGITMPENADIVPSNARAGSSKTSPGNSGVDTQGTVCIDARPATGEMFGTAKPGILSVHNAHQIKRGTAMVSEHACISTPENNAAIARACTSNIIVPGLLLMNSDNLTPACSTSMNVASNDVVPKNANNMDSDDDDHVAAGTMIVTDHAEPIMSSHGFPCSSNMALDAPGDHKYSALLNINDHGSTTMITNSSTIAAVTENHRHDEQSTNHSIEPDNFIAKQMIEELLMHYGGIGTPANDSNSTASYADHIVPSVQAGGGIADQASTSNESYSPPYSCSSSHDDSDPSLGAASNQIYNPLYYHHNQYHHQYPHYGENIVFPPDIHDPVQILSSSQTLI